MSNAGEQGPYTEFRVRIPGEHLDRDVTALHDMGALRKWEIAEADSTATGIFPTVIPTDVAIGGDKLITTDDLTTASEDLFGDSAYGETAQAILNYHQKKMSVGIQMKDGIFSIPQIGSGLTQLFQQRPDLTGVVGTVDESDKQIATSTLTLLEQLGTPFISDVVTEEGLLKTKYRIMFRVANFGVSAARLGVFLERTGITGHQLHGGLGKALDILNVVANVADPKVDPLEDVGPTASPKEILEAAKEAGIAVGDTRKGMLSRVAKNLSWNATHGKPHGQGEVIVDKGYDITDSEYGINSRKSHLEIAVASLEVIAREYPGTRQSKCPAFLRAFIAEKMTEHPTLF